MVCQWRYRGMSSSLGTWNTSPFKKAVDNEVVAFGSWMILWERGRSEGSPKNAMSGPLKWYVSIRSSAIFERANEQSVNRCAAATPGSSQWKCKIISSPCLHRLIACWRRDWIPTWEHHSWVQEGPLRFQKSLWIRNSCNGAVGRQWWGVPHWVIVLGLQKERKRGVVDEFRDHGFVQVAWGGQSDGRCQLPHCSRDEGICLDMSVLSLTSECLCYNFTISPGIEKFFACVWIRLRI